MQASKPADPGASGGTRTGLRPLQPLWALLCVLLLGLATTVATLQAPHPNPFLPLAQRGLLDLLRYPIEVNALRRLPAAPGAMYGVACQADGRRVWAVGDGGTVLVSEDGGRRWTEQASGVQTSLHALQMQPDGRRGWVVGAGGTVLATVDGGQAWTAHPTGADAELWSVHFHADGLRGWAVGTGGTVLATADGGQRWQLQPSGVDTNLWAVDFADDGLHGWAVGAAGTLLATRDGGQRWQSQASGTQSSLWGVRAGADGQRAWAVGNDGTLLATRDGGQRWTDQASGVKLSLKSVHLAADGRRGWVVGDGGTVLSTEDGGERWTAQAPGLSAELLAVHFAADGQQGWAVGPRGTILATQDGGRQWQAQASGAQASLTALHWRSGSPRAWAVGPGGRVLATTDGGRTWSAQASGVTADLQAVQLHADDRRGWAVGDRGTVLLTTDGGARWTAADAVPASSLMGVHLAADGQRGWAVGHGGTLLATTDGGRRWAEVDSGSPNDLRAVRVSDDGQQAWAVGAGGTVLATRDGGRRWAPQPSGVRADLWAVHLLADGQRGWTVGSEGTILATRDGGARWTRQASGVRGTLWSVRFLPDGQRGWASGTGGTLLSTTNGGETWQAITQSKVGTSRLALAIADDEGRQVWAVGYPPALLHTADGGQTWGADPWPLRYARYPAPWYGLCLVALALAWWRALRPGPALREHGAEALVTTDAPAAALAQDRLRFAPLARGISRFLRNAATEPPLTLAISGDWGSGKSSLMGQLCDDLRRHGTRPVWFNAWHHQKDDHLLAALLQAVRSQALPPWWTPDGAVFRLRLLWLRSVKHFLLVMAAGVAVAALAGFLATHDGAAWGRLWAALGRWLPWLDAMATGQPAALSQGDVGRLLAQLLSGITVLAALRKALTAFGADPAVLLSAAAEQFRLKDASALTNFRARFAVQFDEVTRCLPSRMVIVIDDLDRCRPESVLDVMESVNFLVSSGACFVVFGMATHRVQSALALSFEKIASESTEPADDPDPAGSAGDPARHARERRRRYARDYLEKLVNLEIAVPAGDRLSPHALLEPAPRGPQGLHQALRPVLRLWPLVLLAVALPAGWHLGARWQFADPPPPTVVKLGALAPAAGASVPARPGGAGAGRESAGRESAAGRDGVAAAPVRSQYPVPTVQPGDDRPIAWPALALPLGLLLAWGAGFAAFRLRAQLHQVQDSPAFRDALRAWLPLVQAQRRTPRALKRFGNRIRYLAMLQQAERLDASRLDAWRAALARWTGQGAMATPPAPAAAIGATAAAPADDPATGVAEDTLVALGALYEVCGPAWRDGLGGRVPRGLEDALHQAIERHRALGDGTRWPPSAAELDAFERSLQGIRVPSA